MVHPVAGKCKHCKADLTAYRSARPAASAPLPALQQAQPSNGHANGAVPHVPPVHAPIAVAHEPQAVLPPRPTARSHTAEPTGSTWRSWPVIVIVLAMAAIVAAVVLMVWPSGESEPGKRTLQPPPAPERMLTDPDIKPPQQPPPARPPGGAPDPWSSDLTPSPDRPSPAPSPPAPTPDPDVDFDDDQDVDALKDPFASRDPSAARPRLGLNRRGALAGLMVVHLCRKLISCRIDDPVAASVCDQISPPQAPPPSCPAAMRCLKHIDDLGCDNQSTDMVSIMKLMTQFEDCTEAASC
jgi:hypothetical protein